MMPVVLVGSYFGTMVNLLMPEIVICGAMTLLLAYLTWNTYQRARKMYMKETQSKNYRELPGEQPYNLFEFKTLSNHS